VISTSPGWAIRCPRDPQVPADKGLDVRRSDGRSYPPMDQPHRPLFEALLALIHGERRAVESVDEEAEGPQGASGSRIGYFRVVSRDPRGGVHADRLVSKHAPLLECRILRLLSDQGCAVPPLATADVAVDGRAPVVMPYLEERPVHGGGSARPLGAIAA
jgi:hypothetical protein